MEEGDRKQGRDVFAMMLESYFVQNSWTALTVAAAGGYTDVVRSVLELHPNVNAVDKVAALLHC